MLVWHFSRFILFMATRSCLGVQRAACTTAVAPLPGIKTTAEDKVDGSREEHKQANISSHCSPSAALWRLLTFGDSVFVFIQWYSSLTPAKTSHKHTDTSQLGV